MSKPDKPEERQDGGPRQGESPAEPPREDPPTPDEADLPGVEPWHQVPNPTGFGGVPWEELRKGTIPRDDRTPEQALWDDTGVSKPQQIDYPKKTWDELPEETEPAEEKIH